MTASTSSTGGSQAYGFIPDPGTNFSYGQESQIAQRLNQLAQTLKTNIYGISGYRTPQHSVAVGGFANDPHTAGQAADIGFGSSLRASAAQITNAELASVGLWRPFDTTDAASNTEVNHIQLLPDQGGPKESVTAPTSSYTGPVGRSANPAGPIAAAASGSPQQTTDLNPLDALNSFFGGIWSSIMSKAEYAALAFVAIVGGFILIARGISRASHAGAS